MGHEGRRAFFRQDDPPPDGPSALGWRGYGQCVFCGSPETVWQHDLNQSLSSFRSVFGKGKIWGGAQALCESCESLYRTGDYAALARLRSAEPPSYENELADHLISLVAFARADRGPRPLAEPQFPAGFEPLDCLTGADWLFGLWPEDCRLVMPETRQPQLSEDPRAQLWLVKSPWPALDLVSVFRVLWSWAERDRTQRPTQPLMESQARHVLGWSEQLALEWLAQLG